MTYRDSVSVEAVEFRRLCHQLGWCCTHCAKATPSPLGATAIQILPPQCVLAKTHGLPRLLSSSTPVDAVMPLPRLFITGTKACSWSVDNIYGHS